MADRLLTVWSNDRKHEALIYKDGEVAFRTGLAHRSSSAARRAAMKWHEANPEPEEICEDQ